MLFRDYSHLPCLETLEVGSDCDHDRGHPIVFPRSLRPLRLPAFLLYVEAEQLAKGIEMAQGVESITCIGQLTPEQSERVEQAGIRVKDVLFLGEVTFL